MSLSHIAESLTTTTRHYTPPLQVYSVRKVFGFVEELVVEDSETINRPKHRPSAVNSADVFTKLLEEDAHWRHMTELGMVPVDPSWVRSR